MRGVGEVTLRPVPDLRGLRELDDDSVTLDANHPLAGEALTFALTLVEIV